MCVTRNSAVADKPRDAFVQIQWRGYDNSISPYIMLPCRIGRCSGSNRTVTHKLDNLRPNQLASHPHHTFLKKVVVSLWCGHTLTDTTTFSKSVVWCGASWFGRRLALVGHRIIVYK